MTKIISSPNCENSPKINFLQDFRIAFAKRNLNWITERVSDEMIWTIIGNKKIVGKERFVEVLSNAEAEIQTELRIDKILSHGKEGVISGMYKVKNGLSYAFSDFYSFENAKGVKIKLMITYLIKI